ncbi:MAG: YceH family protein [Acidobacteriota bacterium]
MTVSMHGDTTPERLPHRLDAREVRVLGALLEKEQATPDHYPLTVNALVQACNQKSNRQPVMRLSEGEVRDALERLFQHVLVWKSEGARAVRWRHAVDRRWQLTPPTKAVLTLLLLRGPQTVGELRGRSDRLHAFTSVSEVDDTLATLASGREPLVRQLPRGPGQKESRWVHLVGEDEEVADTEGTAAAAPEAPGAPPEPDRLARLEQRVADLEARLEELSQRFPSS